MLWDLRPLADTYHKSSLLTYRWALGNHVYFRLVHLESIHFLKIPGRVSCNKVFLINDSVYKSQGSQTEFYKRPASSPLIIVQPYAYFWEKKKMLQLLVTDAVFQQLPEALNEELMQSGFQTLFIHLMPSWAPKHLKKNY